MCQKLGAWNPCCIRTRRGWPHWSQTLHWLAPLLWRNFFLHLTPDTWHVKLDTWHMRYNMWCTGIVGAVLQTPLLLIIQLSNSSFVKISSKPCLSQTISARELKFWENVEPSPCVTCHMSPVMGHKSPVTCHWTSQWGVCYQRGPAYPF